jgi:hypothetical protein
MTPTQEREKALEILDRGLDEICAYAFDTKLEKARMRKLIRSTCNVLDRNLKAALTAPCQCEKLVEALERISEYSDEPEAIMAREALAEHKGGE